MWDEHISIFHRPKPQWDAAKMKVKTDGGGWMVFSYEGEGRLNMSRPVGRDCKIAYRHRKEPERDQTAEKVNPLMFPPVDNYKEFRVRKRLSASTTEKPPVERRPPSGRDIDAPIQGPLHLKGDITPRRPRRRRAETELAPEKARVTISARLPAKRGEGRHPNTPRVETARPGFSLFERSLKQREEIYEWPRDFQHFTTDCY